MSGFAVSIGSDTPSPVDKMDRVMTHRGTFAVGSVRLENAVVAQRHLNADIPEADTDAPAVPFTTDGLAVAWDGQLGDLHTLEQHYKTDSEQPLREERLLAAMYRREGAKLFEKLDDAIFTFAITDGTRLLAARDVLGIKTLFYGYKDDVLLLSSELKGLAAVTDDVREFPAGHYMIEDGTLTRFAELPSSPPPPTDKPVEAICEDIRSIIADSIDQRVNFHRPTGALLSGGMDSSVICALAAPRYREQMGRPLKTFVVGLGESGDIVNARLMADHLGTDHQELIVDINRVMEVLPEVVYHLESFDPSLVRSAVSNYLISREAADQGIEVLLSGEGGDEIFCGYTYLKKFPPEQMFARQMECLGYLHSNASLRLDRMNQCNGIRVVAPLISGRLLDYTLTVPAELKQKPEEDRKVEKWIFRKAYEGVLPEQITWRLKQEFSQGSGSADQLPGQFDRMIRDDELTEAQQQFSFIRSKEELYYFRIFTEHFGTGRAVETVGQWVTL